MFDNIRRAAALMAQPIAGGRWAHTFDYGHVTILVEEMYPLIRGFLGFHQRANCP